jgi:hypothetical protein
MFKPMRLARKIGHQRLGSKLATRLLIGGLQAGATVKTTGGACRSLLIPTNPRPATRAAL